MTPGTRFDTLISTEELGLHLHHPDWVLIDCRFDLGDVAAGERAYLEGHIPGAVYASLDRDLSGPKTGRNGRHPLPNPNALVRAFGGWGIGEGAQVVAYDQDTGIYASRLWWLLRYLGHPSVAVLDGGFAKWTREHRPTVPGSEPRASRSFAGEPHDEQRLTVADVEHLLAEDPPVRLVDARAPERFQGLAESIDRVAGHIPGAINHFFRNNLGPDATFLDSAELRARWTRVLGSSSAEGAVMYCGSGVTACHNLLALEHAGLTGARLYPGSWSEWSSDPNRPIEKS